MAMLSTVVIFADFAFPDIKSPRTSGSTASPTKQAPYASYDISDANFSLNSSKAANGFASDAFRARKASLQY